jgi:hypothetical protein
MPAAQLVDDQLTDRNQQAKWRAVRAFVERQVPAALARAEPAVEAIDSRDARRNATVSVAAPATAPSPASRGGRAAMGQNRNDSPLG